MKGSDRKRFGRTRSENVRLDHLGTGSDEGENANYRRLAPRRRRSRRRRLQKRKGGRKARLEWRRIRRLTVWVSALVVLVAAIVALAIFRKKYTSQVVPESGVIVVEEDAFDPGEPEDWVGALPIEIAEAFVGTSRVADLLPLVRDPDRVAPLMRDFFEHGAGANEMIVGIRPAGPVATSDLTFEAYHVDLAGGGNRLLCVVVTEDEGAKVDFESYARYGTAEWDDLLSQDTGRAEVVRVELKRGAFYGHQFSSDEDWTHYRANSPDLEKGVDFYAPRGSRLDRKLMALTSRGVMQATLRVRSVDGSFSNRQFEVTGRVAVGWVVGGGE